MREVRVENLEDLEVVGGEARLRLPSENLELVLTEDVLKGLSTKAASLSDDGSDEGNAEVEAIRRDLGRLAAELRFTTIMEDVSGNGFDYDLVLRSSDLYAVTTGYVFSDSAVDDKLVRRVRRALTQDEFVEQACVICPSATEEAFAGCDDDTRILSVKGRTSSVSRFEMAPELWRTLSETRGWRNIAVKRNMDTNERQEV